ncbi:MAG: Xaa-Pro peptidase family protein [Nitrospirota bacterium]
MLPKNESTFRIERLKVRLKDADIDGALIIYPVDVYYFSGTRQNALLWIPAEDAPVLLVRKSCTRARSESVIDDVRPMPSSKELPDLFNEHIHKIGITFDVLPVQQYRFYAGLLPGREFVDISAINRELRSVKSEWELEQLRASGRKLSEVFSTIPSFLTTGMRELDLAAELEYRLKRAGSDGHLRIRAFNQEIVCLAVAGENAAVPGCFDGAVTGKGLSAATPFGPSTDIIKEHTPVIVDYAGVFNGYIVDMTRIFAIGDLAPELKRAFGISLEIERWIVEYLKPGAIGEELFAGAVRIAEAAGLGEHFMGYPGEQSKFVGHGVGLELDELPLLAPRFKDQLETGQTLAIEPKFVFPGKGTVGIENTYAITAGGAEKLTNLPSDIVYL